MTTKSRYNKNAIIQTAIDTWLDGFDHQDKPVTLKFRAGSYYDIHSLTYIDNTYVDILFCDGHITPKVNRREVGLSYIGDPVIYDNRTTDQKVAWTQELKEIDDKLKKKNDDPPMAPKTIHLKKGGQKQENEEKKKSSGWFTKSDEA